MKNILKASFVTAFALSMLLPVTHQVNAASTNQPIFHQGMTPPPGGGGHIQGMTPPPGGGGHIQGMTPPPGGGGH